MYILCNFANNYFKQKSVSDIYYLDQFIKIQVCIFGGYIFALTYEIKFAPDKLYKDKPNL